MKRWSPSEPDGVWARHVRGGGYTAHTGHVADGTSLWVYAPDLKDEAGNVLRKATWRDAERMLEDVLEHRRNRESRVDAAALDPRLGEAAERIRRQVLESRCRCEMRAERTPDGRCTRCWGRLDG